MDKVLVVDDELGPRESIRFLLKNEFDVLCADSVDQGIKMFDDTRPDIVIMDVKMPVKSGIDGLREIRQRDTDVSVVILTGYGALETAQEAVRLGANDYMNKPFDAEEMRTTVRRYVRRTQMRRKRVAMLHELQEVNKRLVDELADKEEAASTVQSTAEIAHDMRNPLMIVSGYVDLLTRQIERFQDAMGDQYGKSADYLDVIAQNVRRCCDLAHMWQKYGKTALREVKLIPMAELMKEIEMGVEPLAATDGVEIRYEMDVGDAVIKGNRAQLIRAIHNVISNAIQAVPAKQGCVWVQCAGENSHVELRVRDNGCGMEPAVLEKVFEPYFTTKAQKKGTGLGMAITKRILDEHRGGIHITSVPGKGTEVTISLPLDEGGAPSP